MGGCACNEISRLGSEIDSLRCIIAGTIRTCVFLFNTIFLSSHTYPEKVEGTMNMGYVISDTVLGLELARGRP